MIKELPIRLRLTILSILLLTVCCVILTFILTFSANNMADMIEAIPLTPAREVGENAISIAENEAFMTPAEAIKTTASQKARTSFICKSIFYMFIVVVTGGVFTYYISGKALKPLQELSSQMKNRTVHNLLEDLNVPESHDEISDLTHSFNEMSNKLGDSFAMQKRFSQSAAHELRTPLTVLKTKVDVFKKKPNHNADEYDKLLDVISTHTNRLSDLVKDLLELTNMDALECNQSIEVRELLVEVTEELSLIAKEKNICVKVKGETQMMLANKSLLHRAFYNLIENAIKYNQENGKINIELSTYNKRATITITDTGIGIAEELREVIFEPFFRADKSRSRQMGGAGLGLSMVKSIISKHNGTVSVFKNPGGGTIFKIVFE